jgi:hypothetical protein
VGKTQSAIWMELATSNTQKSGAPNVTSGVGKRTDIPRFLSHYPLKAVSGRSGGLEEPRPPGPGTPCRGLLLRCERLGLCRRYPAGSKSFPERCREGPHGTSGPSIAPLRNEPIPVLRTDLELLDWPIAFCFRAPETANSCLARAKCHPATGRNHRIWRRRDCRKSGGGLPD